MYLEIFPNEIINRICDYLCYVDVVALKFTNKFFYGNVVLKDINKMILEEFRKHSVVSEISDLILDEINDLDITIGGSFMLSILTGSKWKYNDILISRCV